MKEPNKLINFSILNIDKPANCTSFDVVNHIRKKLNLAKCGHLGTLDPMVTGVLPIVLEKACKIQEYLMHQNKIYEGKMLFHKSIEKKKVEEVIKKFIGKINQLPPRVSRVKRVLREREIISFKLTNFNEEKREASFICEVQAGTYIRKLISDLGVSLGVECQMIELRRTCAGLFSSKDSNFISLEEFNKLVEEAKIESKIVDAGETIKKLLDKIEIKEEFVQKLYNGSPIFEEMLEDKNKKEAMKIIEEAKPFLVVSQNRIIEIAKQNKEKSKGTNILAWPEVVLK